MIVGVYGGGGKTTMKKTIIILAALTLTLVLLNTAVGGSEIPELEELNKELQGKKIPEPLGSLFGNERIDVHFELESGQELVVGLTTKDKKLQSLKVGGTNKPSLKIYTSEATVKEIASSANQAEALIKAFNDKKITYKAVGIKNKIKFAFISLFIKLGNLFGGEDVAETVEEKETTERQATESKEEITGKVVEELSAEGGGKEEEKKQVEESREEESLSGTEEDKGKENTVAVEETQKVIVEEGPETHIVELIDGGFGISEPLTISVGDIVKWENIRSGTFKKALIVGAQQCIKIKSGFFESGESFSWTFDKAETCTIVDGIYTTQIMKVIVQE